jgi:hypothetical protein
VKDLYSKLGIDRGASAGEVQAALELKPGLKDDATVLLNTQKRALYDSTHSTLKLIGELRFRLGLDTGPSWFLEHCPDYAFRKNAAKSSRDAEERAGTDASPGAHPPTQQPKRTASTPPAHARLPAKWPARWPSKWLVPAVLLIIGVILIAALLR